MMRWIVAFAVIAAALAAGAQEPNGKEIYLARCSFCHGPDGRGDGPAGSSLEPPPTNFSDRAYWKSATAASIRNAIENGKPRTAMMPFSGTLTPPEIDALVGYVKTFAPK
jgi:high-affinity iron transporter